MYEPVICSQRTCGQAQQTGWHPAPLGEMSLPIPPVTIKIVRQQTFQQQIVLLIYGHLE
jgi:hypothetical protein